MPIVRTIGGVQYVMGFQVANVNKPLGAVSRITDPTTDVVFRHKSRGGSFIYDVEADTNIPLRETGGIYYLDVWVRPGHEMDKSDFTRQGN